MRQDSYSYCRVVNSDRYRREAIELSCLVSVGEVGAILKLMAVVKSELQHLHIEQLSDGNC